MVAGMGHAFYIRRRNKGKRSKRSFKVQQSVRCNGQRSSELRKDPYRRIFLGATGSQQCNRALLLSREMRSEPYSVLLAKGANDGLRSDFVCFCAREGDYKELENIGHFTCLQPPYALILNYNTNRLNQLLRDGNCKVTAQSRIVRNSHGE